MIDIHATQTTAFTLAVEGDGVFRYTDLNAAASRNSGISREDQVGKRPEECFPPALAEHVLRFYRECAETNAPVVYETEYVLPSGYCSWRTSLVPFVGADGRVDRLLAFCRDGTQTAVARRGIDAFHEDLKLAVGAIDGGFWSYEIATGAFETSRPLAELIAGPGRATLNLAEYASHVHAEDLSTWSILYPAHDLATVEYRVVTHDGRTRWLQGKRRVIRDDKGEAKKIFTLVVDVTEQKARFKTLESEASLDPMTSLRNRRSFDREASNLLRAAQASGETIGLLLFGLDGLKEVNESHGRRAGDETVRAAARRIARHKRKADTLARIGGAEFAILVREATPETCEAIVARIARAFAKPFETGVSGLGLRAGLALSRPGDRSIGNVFDRADAALAPQCVTADNIAETTRPATIDLLRVAATEV